jgi:5-methylcytosine-specific restriction endonuclease McrA
MTLSLRNDEVRALRQLVEAHTAGPDEWGPEHHDIAQSAARTLEVALRRHARTTKAKPKRKSDEVAWVEARGEALLRDRFRCIPQMAEDCSGHAEHVHHIAGRVGKDPHRLTNLVSVCYRCHESIHGNPRRAYDLGWMRKRNT